MYTTIVRITAFCLLFAHVPIAALPITMSHSSRHATGTEADEWQWGPSLPMHSHHPTTHPENIQPAAFTPLPTTHRATSTPDTTLKPETISSASPEATVFFPINSAEPSVAPGTEPFATIHPSVLLEAPSQSPDLYVTAPPSFTTDHYLFPSPTPEPSAFLSINTAEPTMGPTNTLFDTIESTASMGASLEEPSEVPASSMTAAPTIDTDDNLSSTLEPSGIPSINTAEPTVGSTNDVFPTVEPGTSMPAPLEAPSELPPSSTTLNPTIEPDDNLSSSPTPEASAFPSTNTAEPSIEPGNTLFATTDPSTSTAALLEAPSDIPTLSTTADPTFDPISSSSTPEPSGVLSTHTAESSAEPAIEIFPTTDPSTSMATPSELPEEARKSPVIEFSTTLPHASTQVLPAESTTAPSLEIFATIVPMPMISEAEPLDIPTWFVLRTSVSATAEIVPSPTRTPPVRTFRNSTKTDNATLYNATTTLSPLPSSSIVPSATASLSAGPSISIRPPFYAATETPGIEMAIGMTVMHSAPSVTRPFASPRTSVSSGLSGNTSSPGISLPR